MAASTCYLSALLSRVSSIPLGFHGGHTSYTPLHVGPTAPPLFPLGSSPPRSSVIAFWRPKKKKKKSLNLRPKKKTALDDFMEEEEQEYIEEEEEEFDNEEQEYSEEDALEAFFSQLEKDINNSNLSEEDVEIKEEDVEKFEKELAQALGEEEEEEEEELDTEEIEEADSIRLPQLKTWQMRKLARALKIGRRKASVRSCSEQV